MHQLFSFLLLLADSHYYSQSGQDQYVNENFFFNKENGVFVDVGAFDGVLGSNTCFFERTLNWKGICIEPNPELFENLCLNRTSININACASDEKGTKEFLQIVGHNETLSGLVEKYDPRQRALVDQIASQHNDIHHFLEVECILLMDIFKEYSIDYIDYLSVDTEGGELDILKSINYDEVFIDVIDVENNYSIPDFQEFLTSKGYRFITRIGVDEIYKKHQ
jgi:FkbM family methyltransferase